MAAEGEADLDSREGLAGDTVKLTFRIGGRVKGITVARVFDAGGYCGELALDTDVLELLGMPVAPGGLGQGDYLVVDVKVSRLTRASATSRENTERRGHG